MSLNFTGVFATIASIGAKAEAVASKAVSYIETVEQIGAQVGLTGVQKLAAVKDALVADIGKTDTALAQAITEDWQAVAGAVSGVVSLYNAAKLFVSVAGPAVAAAVPGAGPVIGAIEAGEGVIDHALGEIGG